MIDFPGYSDIVELKDGSHTELFSAKKDHQKVIIKLLNKKKPSKSDLQQFQYEYELLKDIDDEYIVKVIDFQLLDDSCFIVMLDTDTQSVQTLLDANALTMEDKLDIVLQTAKALQNLQEKEIIHKSLTLSSIFYNQETKLLKLSNFADAIRLRSERKLFDTPHAQEGNLFYFSPEQTGRMNRHVDYRSDLYALGVCMYKLFCGRFPFEQNKKLELYHAIIALPAKEPITINAKLPKVLNGMIMKLLEKNAEQRYQSAYGLTLDIKRVIKQLQNSSSELFELGRDDHRGKLHIPEKLFGRDKEVSQLLSSFERVTKGGKEILLVAGYSGVGKSVLVSEVHKPITKSRGFYIEGKFDQFQRDKPYLAIIQAFNAWSHMILSEPVAEQKRWKTKILEALGRNAQVIIDLIPSFEELLGEQESVEELSGMEAQNRFNFLFSTLIRTIASSKQPLVIFIDDLQWSDQATLNLIDAIFQDQQCSHLLLFGAYRDNEVDDTHPFIKTMRQIEKENISMSTLHISNLTKDDVSHLLSETLHQSVQEVDSLVELVYAKTAGNAFFVNNFITALEDEKLLSFDFESQKWCWDIKDLYDKNLTDNVVDLMSQQISKFSDKTQKLLTLASCIGNRFDLFTLSIISENSHQEAADDLESALESGLIIPLKEAYKYVQFSQSDENIYYKFSHDRIQQAAYAFLSPKEKPSIHLHIGDLLNKSLTGQEREKRVFDIVNHTNIGHELISDTEIRFEMAKMNLEAAHKAKKAVAFKSSYGFLDFAQIYLCQNHWENDYKLSYEIWIMKAELAYMIQEFTASKELIDEILQYSKSGVEKAEAYNISIIRETMQGNYLEAIEYGRQGMDLVGFTLPDDHYDQSFGQEMGEISAYLETHTIASLSELPVCHDPAVAVANKILMNLGPPTYFVLKPLYPVICSSFVLLAIKHGNTDVSAGAYSNYGIVLAAMMGQYEAGYEFGLASLALDKTFDNMQESCKNNFNFGMVLNSWMRPLSEGLAAVNRAYDVGMQSGELQFVGYSIYSKLLFAFVAGESIDDIIHNLSSSYKFQEKTKNQWALDSIGALSLALYHLKGESPQLIDEEAFLQSASINEGGHGLCFYKIFKAQYLFVMQDYDQSFSLTSEAEAIIFNIFGLLPVADCNYYNSLSLSMLSLEKDLDQREEDIKRIETNQEQLKIWSDNVKENFLHKFLAVEAQLAWLKGNLEGARKLYNEAITSALHNNFLQDVAIISECYAQFLLKNDSKRVAEIYFQDALYYYERWNADAKVESLKKFMTGEYQTHKLKADGENDTVDYNSLIQSIQLISSEVELHSLVSQFVSIAMENAGAQRGLFLLLKDDILELTLEKDIQGRDHLISKKFDELSEDDYLIHKAVKQSLNTLQDVTIENACEDEQYAKLSYVKKHKPLSVLVLPIIHNGSLEALLYLENSLVSQLFTPQRVELLRMLGAQVGISFENFRLYENLEHTIAERTQALQASNRELSDTMTNLQSAQNQLVESEKIASLGSLVAGIAHEINTPVGLSITGITSVHNSTKQIKENYANDKMTQKAFEEYLETTESLTEVISKNLNQAGELIRNFKKLAVDQNRDEKSEFVLKELIEEVVSTFNTKLQEAGIELLIECDCQAKMNSYLKDIYEVLGNMIKNSMLHAFDKQPTKEIRIKIKTIGKVVEIRFCDNGKGILEKNLSKVFDPFYTTKMGQGGTGLGLHVVYNIVTQRLKGEISVTSTQKPLETCFLLKLPLST